MDCRHSTCTGNRLLPYPLREVDSLQRVLCLSPDMPGSSLLSWTAVRPYIVCGPSGTRGCGHTADLVFLPQCLQQWFISGEVFLEPASLHGQSCLLLESPAVLHAVIVSLLLQTDILLLRLPVQWGTPHSS